MMPVPQYAPWQHKRRDDVRQVRAAGSHRAITNTAEPIPVRGVPRRICAISCRFTDLICARSSAGPLRYLRWGTQRLPEQLAADLPIGASTSRRAATGVREGGNTDHEGNHRQRCRRSARASHDLYHPARPRHQLLHHVVPPTPDVPGPRCHPALDPGGVDPERRGPLLSTASDRAIPAPQYAPPARRWCRAPRSDCTSEPYRKAPSGVSWPRCTGSIPRSSHLSILDVFRDGAATSIRQPVEPSGTARSCHDRDTASIQGALVSGRRAADAVLRARRRRRTQGFHDRLDDDLRRTCVGGGIEYARPTGSARRDECIHWCPGTARHAVPRDRSWCSPRRAQPPIRWCGNPDRPPGRGSPVTVVMPGGPLMVTSRSTHIVDAKASRTTTEPRLRATTIRR